MIQDVKTINELRLENVTFGYDPSSPVFTNLTLDLPTNQNVLVGGPPGQGQSTLLKLIAVVHQPQQGQVIINGQNTSDMSFEEFLPFRKKIGYTFDYGGLFANRTILDNLVLPLLYHGICPREEAFARAEWFAEDFKFTNRLQLKPAAVTGGLRKLVSVLRTLLLEPEMLVMDDPFMGVDTENVRRLIRLIREKRETGEIKHLFFTSRDEVWPQKLGFEQLTVKDGSFQFAGDELKRAAA